jgi:hypothetical protein
VSALVPNSVSRTSFGSTIEKSCVVLNSCFSRSSFFNPLNLAFDVVHEDKLTLLLRKMKQVLFSHKVLKYIGFLDLRICSVYRHQVVGRLSIR